MELGIVQLAAGILEIPIEELLPELSRSLPHSESSTSLESVKTSSIDSEQEGEYREGLTEPIRQETSRQQSRSLPTPDFQVHTGTYPRDCNAEHQADLSFPNYLNLDAQNHIDWWGLDPNLPQDKLFNSSAIPESGTFLPMQQGPAINVQNWDHQSFEKANTTIDHDVSTQTPWNSAQQGPYNITHGAIQPQTDPAEPLPPYYAPDFQLQHSARAQSLLPSSFGSGHGNGTESAEVGPGLGSRDGDKLQLLKATDIQEMRQSNLLQGDDILPDSEPVIQGPSQRRVRKGGEDQKSRRRGPLTDAQRHETNLTRKLGACIRCRWQQIKVKIIALFRCGNY